MHTTLLNQSSSTATMHTTLLNQSSSTAIMHTTWLNQSSSTVTMHTSWLNQSSSEMQNNTMEDLAFLDIEGENFRLVISWMLVFVALCNVLDNGLVIAVVVKYQWLQSHTNYLIVSMCVMGFIDGLVILPLMAVHDIAKVSSDAMCQVISYADTVICVMTLLHLIAINTERYVAVRKPLKYKTIFTRRMTLFNVFAVWGTSIAIGVFVELFFSSFLVDGYCTPAPISYLDGIVVSVCIFWLPFTVACAAYIHIYIIVRRHRWFMESSTRQESKTQDGIYRVIFYVLGSSFFAFGPLATLVLIFNFQDERGMEIVAFYCLPFSIMLIHVGIALNPLVYAFYGLKFRKAIKMMFCGGGVSGNARGQLNHTSPISSERLATGYQNAAMSTM